MALSQLVLAVGVTAFVLVTLRSVGFVQRQLEKKAVALSHAAVTGSQGRSHADTAHSGIAAEEVELTSP